MTEEEFYGRPLDKKDTNPKDAVGIRKAGLSCVPAQPLFELGLAMMEGARKYGRHNYRVAGVRGSVYYDAALRHLASWWEGEDTDPDSGLPHLVKAMACLVVIRDSIINANWVDDRPPSLANGWIADLNKKASDLIDRLPTEAPAYTKEFRTATTKTQLPPMALQVSDVLVTTPVHHGPFARSHSHNVSSPGYIDPKQVSTQQEQEVLALTGSADKSPVRSRN